MRRNYTRIDMNDPKLRMKIHKQQRFWQILLPIGLTAMICVAVAVLLSVRSGSMAQFTQLAHVVTIFLILFVMLSMLLALVIPILLIAGLFKLPPYISVVGQYLLNFNLRVKLASRNAADLSVSPIIKVKEIAAKINKLIESLFQREI